MFISFRFTCVYFDKSAKYTGSDRRLVLFVDPKDPNFNAFVAYTPVRGDYTQVSSFGNIDQVTLVTPLFLSLSLAPLLSFPVPSFSILVSLLVLLVHMHASL